MREWNEVPNEMSKEEFDRLDKTNRLFRRFYDNVCSCNYDSAYNVFNLDPVGVMLNCRLNELRLVYNHLKSTDSDKAQELKSTIDKFLEEE